MNKAKKYDRGKTRLELLAPEALEGMAQVLTFGAEKYDAHNWRQGMAHSRLIGGALRHIMAHMSGEDIDPESGLFHIDHAQCCLHFLSAYLHTESGEDDRWIPPRRDED